MFSFYPLRHLPTSTQTATQEQQTQEKQTQQKPKQERQPSSSSTEEKVNTISTASLKKEPLTHTPSEKKVQQKKVVQNTQPKELSALEEIHLALALDLLKAQITANKMQNKSIQNFVSGQTTRELKKKSLTKNELHFLQILQQYGTLTLNEILKNNSTFQSEFLKKFSLRSIDTSQTAKICASIIEHYFLIENYDIFTTFMSVS